MRLRADGVFEVGADSRSRVTCRRRQGGRVVTSPLLRLLAGHVAHEEAWQRLLHRCDAPALAGPGGGRRDADVSNNVSAPVVSGWTGGARRCVAFLAVDGGVLAPASKTIGSAFLARQVVFICIAKAKILCISIRISILIHSVFIRFFLTVWK